MRPSFLASPNLIFDRFLPSCVLSGGVSGSTTTPLMRLLSPLHSWRFQRRRKLEDQERFWEVRGALPEFSNARFSERAKGEYLGVLKILLNGSAPKDNLSQAVLSSVRSGFRLGPSLPTKYTPVPGGGVISVSSWAPPDPVGGNLGQPNTKPAFVQVVTRHVGIVTLPPAAAAAAAAAAAGGGAASGSSGGVKRVGVSGSSGGASHLWECVAHAESGSLFWWDKCSNVTQWLPPSPANYKAADPLFPFRLEHCGLWEPTGNAAEFRFTQDVVWERSVQPSAPDRWSIVRL